MLHPQKRPLIRKVLEGLMGRLVEIKHQLVDTELSEYHYMYNMLQDLKLTPDQLEVPIPRYFLEDQVQALKERKEILQKILTSQRVPSVHIVVPQRVMSLDEAVRLIQVSERARQGRLRAKFMEEIWRNERARHLKPVIFSDEEREKAAILIQKV
ncbi:dynein regulatory complex protein 11-like [Discoglossus pictus]